jgi:ABC-2 type transport system permease protein
MKQELGVLWRRRRSAYLRAVMPYWRYVMSSGGMAMGFAFILAVQGYAMVLTRMREAGTGTGEIDPWLPAYAAGALTAVLLWNPVRTYVERPDFIYMLPMEGRIGAYFRGSWRSGAAMSIAATLAVLMLYWPLYDAARLGGAAAYAWAAALALGVKAILYFGAWKERQFCYQMDRMLFLGVKTLAVAATGYVLLRGELHLSSMVAIGVIWSAYALALRRPPAYNVHWERLLAEERRTILWHEAWFGFFVDLPHREAAYKPRAYMNGLLRAIRYRRENAFLYLYWRTFIRSSMFLFMLRMIALEALLIWIFPSTWAAVLIYGIFVWLMGLQLRGLQAAPSEPLLAAISPLPPVLRRRSQRAVQRLSNGIGVLLMTLPVFFVAPLPFAVGCAAVGSGSVLLFASGRTNGGE